METLPLTESEIVSLLVEGTITQEEALQARAELKQYEDAQLAQHEANQQVLETVQVDNMLAFGAIQTAKDFISKKGCLEGLLEAYKSESDGGRWVLPLGRFIVTFEAWKAEEQREALQVIVSTTHAQVELASVSAGRQGLLAVFYASRPALLARPDGKTSQAEKRFSFYVSEWRKHEKDMVEAAKQAELAAKLASGQITEEEYHPDIPEQESEEIIARTASQVIWALYNSRAFRGSFISKAGTEVQMRDILVSACKEPAIAIFKSHDAMAKVLRECREPFKPSKKRSKE